MRSTRTALLVTTTLIALLLSGLGQAQEETDNSIQAQPLTNALAEFAEQTGMQLVYPSELTVGVDSSSASTEGTPDEILDQLLASTGLKYEYVNDRTIAIALVSDTTDERGASDSKNLNPTPILMAQNTVAQTTVRNRRQEKSQKRNSAQDEKLEEIIVVGTNLKGVAPVGAPVLVYDRSDIRQSGQTTLEGFLRTVPQVFSPSLSPGAATGEQFVDLRGLGSENTLVLLNGRRIATGGLNPINGTDISSIPSSMVERIEILTDGASAIYGADAIGGVINIVLRNDVRGAETDLLWGTATQGGRTQYRVSQSFGTGWGSGNAVLNYTFDKKEPVLNTDREATLERGNLFPGSVLYPESTDHNVTLTTRQELSNKVATNFSGQYLYRDGGQPDLAAPELFNANETDQFSLSSGLNYELSEDWSVDVVASWSERKSTAQIPGRQQIDDSQSATASVSAQAGGAIFELPGGHAQLALGGEWRRNEFMSQTSLAGVRVSDRENSQRVWSGFGELYVPLVNEENAMPFVQSLGVRLAGRFESYDGFDSDVVPLLGVDWQPFDALTIRGSWGESFRAPNLLEELSSGELTSVLVRPINDPMGTNPAPGRSIGLTIGGATDLLPERSRNLTIGVGFSPESLPGFDASITYYSIDFTDRIQSIVVDLTQPIIFADFFSRRPADPNGAAAFDVEVTDLLSLPVPVNVVDFRPLLGLADEPVTVIIDRRRTNVAGTRSKGIDFDLGYRSETALGDIEVRISGNYILEQGVRPVATVPFTDDINKLSRPVDLRLRKQVSWQRDRMSMDVFVNYVDSYRNGVIFGFEDQKIASWTTVDLTASYVFDSGGFLRGTRVAVNAVNLLDNEPPRLNLPFAGFIDLDVNANALGRFVSIGLTKSW